MRKQQLKMPAQNKSRILKSAANKALCLKPLCYRLWVSLATVLIILRGLLCPFAYTQNWPSI